MTARLENWPRLMNEHIANQMTSHFEWGVHDCLLFSASCVEAITGVDPAAKYRGTYSTALAAYRIMDTAGGIDHLIDSCMGEVRRPLAFAQRGDVVTMPDKKGRVAAGICLGNQCVFAGINGLQFINRCECDDQSWEVG